MRPTGFKTVQCVLHLFQRSVTKCSHFMCKFIIVQNLGTKQNWFASNDYFPPLERPLLLLVVILRSRVHCTLISQHVRHQLYAKPCCNQLHYLSRIVAFKKTTPCGLERKGVVENISHSVVFTCWVNDTIMNARQCPTECHRIADPKNESDSDRPNLTAASHLRNLTTHQYWASLLLCH